MTAEQAELELRAAKRVDTVMAMIAERLPEITRELHTWLALQIPELAGDETIHDLVARSTEADLETAVHMIRCRIPAAEVSAPPAAEAFARRLAQRGVAPSVLLRQYRLAQEYMLDWCLRQIRGQEPDSVAFAASRQLMTHTFQYIDAVCEQVVAAYENERERWLASRNTVRVETLADLLAGAPVDVPVAEAALGHRLDQYHLGLVLWRTDEHDGEAGDLTGLERLLGQCAQILGAGGHPLFAPRDRASGWGWIPLGASPPGAADHTALAALPGEGFRIALGTPAAGTAGFRNTHLEALRAQRVALAAEDRAPRATSYGDQQVRVVALLTADPESTRGMVASALGELAVDTTQAARLRDTLLVFLDERGSYAAAAERLHVHKNTVKYRVDKATAARGRPLDQDRLDLELALIACRWLGAAILPTTRQRPAPAAVR